MVPPRFIASLIGLLATVLLPPKAQAQDNEQCFDLATPSLAEALAARDGQLLAIQVRNPSPGASLAATTLAKEAERRGLKAELLAEPWKTNASEDEDRARAVKVSSDKNTQLVASVELLTGTDPAAARVVVWDRSGKRLASLVGWSTDASNCASDMPRAAGVANPESTQTGDSIWYGGEMALVDLASLGLLFLVPPAAGLVFAFGPPAFHYENQQYLRAGLSFTLRVGLPLAVTAVLIARTPRTGEEDIDPYLISGIEGALLGGLVAALIDDCLLAWKKTSAPAPISDVRSSHDTAMVRVGVTMMPYRQGGGLGLVGRF
jgi:hypothetical protein